VTAVSGGAEALVDTSVAVPLVVEDHEHHRQVVEAAGEKTLGFAGHAAFETFSILTRLPAPARRGPGTVARLLRHNFPASRFLSEDTAADLLDDFPSLGIAGGAVYDALVGATAAHHQLPLLTRDRRALDTYRLLGVTFAFVD
jgi:predicted nucleic acid-binding protein